MPGNGAYSVQAVVSSWAKSMEEECQFSKMSKPEAESHGIVDVPYVANKCSLYALFDRLVQN